MSKLPALRKEIGELTAQIHAVETRPPSRAEMETRIRGRVGDLDERVVYRWHAFTGTEWPRPVDMTLDMPALGVLLGAEKVVAAIADTLEARFGEGIDRAEREKQLQALRTKLHGLEVAEEVEILKLEAGGRMSTQRRSEASPAAILEAWK